MSIQRRILCSVFVIIVLVCLTASASLAKSVFVANHGNDSISAYGINGSSVEYKAKLTLTAHGIGPVDVALDPVSGVLLVSYEGPPVIELWVVAWS